MKCSPSWTRGGSNGRAASLFTFATQLPGVGAETLGGMQMV